MMLMLGTIYVQTESTDRKVILKRTVIPCFHDKELWALYVAYNYDWYSSLSWLLEMHY